MLYIYRHILPYKKKVATGESVIAVAVFNTFGAAMNVLYCITGMLLISVGFSQRKNESLSSLAILRNENGDVISLDKCSPLLSCSAGQTAFIDSTRIVCREKFGLTEIHGSQSKRTET